MGIGFRWFYNRYNELEKGFAMLTKIKNFFNAFCRKVENNLAKELEPELRRTIESYNACPLRKYYDTRQYLESRIRMARRLRSIRLTRWFSAHLIEVERSWEELVVRIDAKFNN